MKSITFYVIIIICDSINKYNLIGLVLFAFSNLIVLIVINSVVYLLCLMQLMTC